MPLRWILTLVLVPALFAQSERVFHFTKLTDVQQLGEVAKTIAAVGGFGAPVVNAENRTLVASGTAAQLAFVEWAVANLDVDAQAQGVHAVVGDHLMAGNPDDAVRIFRIAHAAGVRQFNEMATVVRSIAETKYLYASWTTGSLVMRTTPGFLDLGQWLTERLDRPVAELDFNPHNYDLPAPKDGWPALDNSGRVTVLRVANATTEVDFQHMVTAVRSITEIRRVMSYSATGTIAIRSSTAGAEAAAWVLQQVDRKTSGAVAEYRYPAVDDVIDVIYLPLSLTTAQFQQQATTVRMVTGARRLYTYNRLHAILVRETEERVAQARKLLSEPLVAAK